MSGRDSVVAAVHLEGGCIILHVAVCFVIAGGGGMIPERAQPMCPAIIHLTSVNGDVSGLLDGRRRDNSSGSKRKGGAKVRVKGAMIPSVAGGEFANTFLITKFKLGLKHVKRPFINLSVLASMRPLFSWRCKGERDNGKIGNWDLS
jgi:hypothetical protein